MFVKYLNLFWEWLCHFIMAPIRIFGQAILYIVNLDRKQVRSLFAVAMLAGIIALSAENWVLIGAAHHSVSHNENNLTWFGLLVERTRYNSGLQAWFAIIMGAVVFGADWMKAKFGDKEFGIGKAPDDDDDI